MASGDGGVVLRQVRRLFEVGTVAGISDIQLLERFARGGDEAAFEALVARHGPMVLSLCRHLLGPRHAADDAFQATFLVLVRRAGSIRVDDSLGPWLHGVTRRVAARARQSAGKAEQGEWPDEPLAEDLTGEGLAERRELWSALHEEVGRLPRHYRLPVWSFYFEGRSCEETARLLSCPVGTVKGRLSRARDLLRVRLARRGLGVSAAVVGSCLSPSATRAAVSPALLATTTRAASGFAAGTLGASGAVPAAVALAKGVLGAMLISKGKVAGVALIAGLLTVGLGVRAAQHPISGDPARTSLVPGLISRGEQAGVSADAVRMADLKRLRDRWLSLESAAIPLRDSLRVLDETAGAVRAEYETRSGWPGEATRLQELLNWVSSLPVAVHPDRTGMPAKSAELPFRPNDRVRLGPPTRPIRLGTLSGDDITGEYGVREDGTLDLGPFGKLALAGQKVSDVKPLLLRALVAHMANRPVPDAFIPDRRQDRDSINQGPIGPRDVLVYSVTRALPGRPIFGRGPVREDGTLSLGYYGNVRVEGKTIPEVRVAIAEHLGRFYASPAAREDVEKAEAAGEPLPTSPDAINVSLGWNGSKTYLVTGSVVRSGSYLPEGKVTVFDALVKAGLRSWPDTSWNIQLLRPRGPDWSEQDVFLIDLEAIERGEGQTNHVLRAGDRLTVQTTRSANQDHSLITRYYWVGNLTSSFDRTPDNLETPAQVGLLAIRDLILETIEPASWQPEADRKGVTAETRGTIVPFTLNQSLIIRQTDEIHRRVVSLLRGLRATRSIDAEEMGVEFHPKGSIPVIEKTGPGPYAKLGMTQAKPGTSAGLLAQILADEAKARERTETLESLSKVDARRWPEAETTLIASLRGDRNESVRIMAARTLGQLLGAGAKSIEALKVASEGSDRDGYPREKSLFVRQVAADSLIFLRRTVRRNGQANPDDVRQSMPSAPQAPRNAVTAPPMILDPIELAFHHSNAMWDTISARNSLLLRSVRPEEVGEPGKVVPFGLRFADADRLAAALPKAARVVPIRDRQGEAFKGEDSLAVSIVGTTPDYAAILGLSIGRGRFLSKEDGERFENRAVLGAEVARRLFPESDPIGQAIKLRTDYYTVVGVLDRFQRAKDQYWPGGDVDSSVYLPLSTDRLRFGSRIIDPKSKTVDELELSRLVIEFPSRADLDMTRETVYQYKRKHHPGRDVEIIIP